VVGEQGGAPTVTVNQSTMAAHTHNMLAHATNGTTATPTNTTALAKSFPALNPTYKASPSNQVTMNPAAISVASGGGLPHNNMQPYLTITFLIALQGIFPSRN